MSSQWNYNVNCPDWKVGNMRLIDLIEEAYRGNNIELVNNTYTTFAFVISLNGIKYAVNTVYDNSCCQMSVYSLRTKGMLIGTFLEGDLDTIVYLNSITDFEPVNVKTDLTGKVVPKILLDFAEVIYNDYNNSDSEIRFFFEYLVSNPSLTAIQTYFDIDTPEGREVFRFGQGYI